MAIKLKFSTSDGKERTKMMYSNLISNSEIEEDIKKALNKGLTVFMPDGTKHWYSVREVVDTHKPAGSQQYTWDKSGNKILHHIFHVTVKGDIKTEKFIRKSFRVFE